MFGNLLQTFLHYFTDHYWIQVEPKAQLVLVANTSMLNSGDTCPSTSPELPTNASIIGENNSLVHQNGKGEASDVLMTPRLLQNDNPGIGAQGTQNDGTAAVPLNAIQQGVILAQCLLIEKSTRHDEMQSKLADLLNGHSLN